jgi:transglutaminase-like putative cysteine protease
MLFNVSCGLEYAVRFPSTMILSLHAQRSPSQTVLEEEFTIEPRVKVSELVAEETRNRFVYIQTGKAKNLHIAYRATVECNYDILSARELEAVPVAELTPAELQYLFPSRYCQSDRLGRLAWDLFGHIESPFGKVLAICEWVHANVEYVRGSTNSETSAYDTVTQRTGVCRDFAHLGIALSRALNIPARYFTGYAYELDPPDMHACFECLIGGQWTLFDPTRLAHLNGVVRVGIGRDAADASVASIFGSVRLKSMDVQCALGRGQTFTPMRGKQQARQAVSLPGRRRA